MNFDCSLKLTLAALAACTALAATAQTSAPATAPAPALPAASAPLVIKPVPKLLTPSQKRDASTPPDEQLPEAKATPQISIPLGKTPPAPLQPEPKPARGTAGKSNSGVSDAAARCEAETDKQARAACRDKLGSR